MEYLNKLYSGRLNRRTYFVGGIVVGVAYAAIYSLLNPATSSGYTYSPNPVVGLIDFALVVLLLTVGFSLSAKRFHDLGKSGWMSLLMIIPVVNFFVWLYLVLASGKSGSNSYGEQPKDAFEFNKIYDIGYSKSSK